MSEVIKKDKPDTLSDRMKSYENVTRNYLIPNMPIIVRIDGRAFHTYTKQKWCEHPYSSILIECFQKTTLKVCEETSNVVFAYHQSDEVSFFLKDYEKRDQQQIFQGNIQKIVSTFASKFTIHFNKFIQEALLLKMTYFETNPEVTGQFVTYQRAQEDYSNLKIAEFDARVFNLPVHEVTNYFIWRQKDWERNSVTQYASSIYSHNQLMNKSTVEKLDMINQSGNKPWQNLAIHLREGTFFKKVEVELPIKELSEEQVKWLTEEEMVEGVMTRKKWIIDHNSPVLYLNKEYLEEIVQKIKE